MLERFLTAFIQQGRLTVILADGKIIRTGSPSNEISADVVIRLKHARTVLKIALRPELYFGEAYMDGSLSLEKGDLWDLLDVCGRNLAHRRTWQPIWFAHARRKLARYLQQHNSLRAARRNVAHHYDLSERLFRSFLDNDLQYSCAYFREPTFSLDQAQAAKKRHILAKLSLASGQRVLDIGCGWGGLAISMAQDHPVHVTAITLSQDQLKRSRQRAAEAYIDKNIDFSLRDYRQVEGQFDRIVSVGMFEHVGRPNYGTFFGKVATLLADDGVALIHSIGRMDGPGLTDAWTRKYIFPGGYIPALSEVLPAVERAGLWVTDIEILRLHYAETLRAWRERFLEQWALKTEGVDERFRRMWEFYLAGSEMAFRYGGLMVFQLQLAKRVDALPLTRDYMFAQERE